MGMVVKGEKEKLLWVRWSKVSEKAALECLRPERCGIVIGDGETWGELRGVENLWCGAHGVPWKMRAFVRKS